MTDWGYRDCRSSPARPASVCLTGFEQASLAQVSQLAGDGSSSPLTRETLRCLVLRVSASVSALYRVHQKKTVVKVLRHLQGRVQKILLRVSSCPSFPMWQKSHAENNIHSTGLSSLRLHFACASLRLYVFTRCIFVHCNFSRYMFVLPILDESRCGRQILRENSYCL